VRTTLLRAGDTYTTTTVVSPNGVKTGILVMQTTTPHGGTERVFIAWNEWPAIRDLAEKLYVEQQQQESKR
jgi:hypothetical protein